MSARLLHRICFIFLSLVNVPEHTEEKIQRCKWMVWRPKARLIQQTLKIKAEKELFTLVWDPEKLSKQMSWNKGSSSWVFLKSCSIPIHFPMQKPCSDWMESLTPMSLEAGTDKIIQLAEGVWGYQMVKGHQQPWARDGTTAPAQLHTSQLQRNREGPLWGVGNPGAVPSGHMAFPGDRPWSLQGSRYFQSYPSAPLHWDEETGMDCLSQILQTQI